MWTNELCPMKFIGRFLKIVSVSCTSLTIAQIKSDQFNLYFTSNNALLILLALVSNIFLCAAHRIRHVPFK